VLLARQNRFRLEGEIIRDCSLAAGGLLHRSVGGPSVRPKGATGPDRYRRSLYTAVQRTVPDLMLTTFDAPDSHVTCTRRDRTNTPLQALTLLNDAAFVECARALGRRVLEESPATDRLRHVFRLCLAREPSSREMAVLDKLLREQRVFCQAHPESAAALAGPAPLPAGVSIPEAAAWVGLARTLLNLDEFITRE
jgi:hypothetical protein